MSTPRPRAGTIPAVSDTPRNPGPPTLPSDLLLVRPKKGAILRDEAERALEALIRAWQGEHRTVGFTSIAMGDTFTEFARDQDMAMVGAVVKRWAEQGYMYGRAMDAASVADQVVNALASPETVRRIAITPHYPHDADAAEADWGAKAVVETRKAVRD